MKASIDWLNDYIDLSDLSPEEIAAHLTMGGLEVEDVSDRFAFLNTVVAALVLKVTPISGSHHLKLCAVEAGHLGEFQVVCGAPNVLEGLVAPLALPNTVLPCGTPIKAAQIHGITSTGMLCSAAELSLGEDASGLMSLTAAPGTSLKTITGRQDWVFEIGITPNRPDALSIIGLARDLSAILNRPLKDVVINLSENGPPVETLAQVEIHAPDHAHRYVARVINKVKIGPSPPWLVNRLAAVGIRSINNIVDITNYVMIEMGQPLHAFDLANLAGQRIIVDTAPQGSHFTTLDGQERELKADLTLMICDGEKPVALAGIMGGLNSEIEDHTQDILLESAYFNPTTVRRTSRTLGLSTDASYRFERGCDPEICLKAANRSAALIAELSGGVVARGAIDCYPSPHLPKTVNFSPQKCNKFLGTHHKVEDMLRVLEAIGIKA
ncbi:MAG: phenylalanine--tRNA ligase subunit beta, partial [Candidatus Adiutrix sp.]